jgi:DNA-binding transcriptional LysR family regulator
MKEVSLAALNLNALVALDALLDTRSVTAAARRVGVSQPAMSRSLKSLRDMFDDPLLVRGKHGLLLTPRAALVREPLRRSLTDLTGVIAGRGDFDPATSTRRFIVEMPDYLMGLLVPALCERVTRDAPGVTLDVRLADRTDILARLEAGTADIVVRGRARACMAAWHARSLRAAARARQPRPRLARPVGPRRISAQAQDPATRPWRGHLSVRRPVSGSRYRP